MTTPRFADPSLNKEGIFTDWIKDVDLGAMSQSLPDRLNYAWHIISNLLIRKT